jgi:hypothetical protein
MAYVVVKLRPFMTSQDLIVSSFMTYKLVCNKNTTTVATCGAGGTLHPSGALDFTAVLKLLVAKSLYFLCSVLLIVVCLFVCFILLLIHNYIVPSSSIYGFWRPVWYLQCLDSTFYLIIVWLFSELMLFFP